MLTLDPILSCLFRGPGIGIIYLAPLLEDDGDGDEAGGSGTEECTSTSPSSVTRAKLVLVVAGK